MDGLSFEDIGNMSDEEFGEKKDTNITEDTDDNLFGEAKSDEDVGTEEENQEGVGGESQGEETIEEDPNSNSPHNNTYASIAKGLKDDGILTLDDSDFENVTSGDDLAALIQKQSDKVVAERLDETTKRVNDALNAEVPVNIISEYERVLSELNRVTEDELKQETKAAEDIRSNIIYQDYINKGFKPEKAEAMVKKSFDAGTDIEDSIEAHKEVLDFFSGQYHNVIKSKQEEKNAAVAKEKELSKQITDRILKTEEPIKGVKLSETERNKILSQYNKFIDTDDDKKPLNELGKYAKENPVEYHYNINLLYHLTNGFKDISKVVNKEVSKAKKSALNNLEKVINRSDGFGQGNMSDYGQVNDSETYKGYNVSFE